MSQLTTSARAAAPFAFLAVTEGSPCPADPRCPAEAAARFWRQATAEADADNSMLALAAIQARRGRKRTAARLAWLRHQLAGAVHTRRYAQQARLASLDNLSEALEAKRQLAAARARIAELESAQVERENRVMQLAAELDSITGTHWPDEIQSQLILFPCASPSPSAA